MKQGIHPNYRADAVITCTTCGTKHEVGSTKTDLMISICSHCHPFYTGEQQVVIDSANKISSFKDRANKSTELKKKIEDLKKKKEERTKSKVGVIGSGNEEKLTLRDLLKANQGGSEKKK